MPKIGGIDIDTYCELPKQAGRIRTFFRKFDTNVWLFQFKDDTLIGQVLLDHDNFEAIYQAPSIKVGDGTTPQTLTENGILDTGAKTWHGPISPKGE